MYEKLVETAGKAKEKAYAPYSNFRVGAALLTEDGKIYTGCNVENISFGLTNCAERTAIFKAVSEGDKGFTKLAISTDTDGYTSPCGACRQVIAEFSADMEIIMANKDGHYTVCTIEELLPMAFNEIKTTEDEG